MKKTESERTDWTEAQEEARIADLSAELQRRADKALATDAVAWEPADTQGRTGLSVFARTQAEANAIAEFLVHDTHCGLNDAIAECGIAPAGSWWLDADAQRSEECRLHIDGARAQTELATRALDAGELEQAAFHGRQIAWHTDCAAIAAQPGFVSRIQPE